MRIFYNHVLTILSNIINNQNLTDAHTCYKMFQSKIFKSIKLKENDFSFCPEITTKIGLKKLKIKEVPIKYFGRSISRKQLCSRSCQTKWVYDRRHGSSERIQPAA